MKRALTLLLALVLCLGFAACHQYLPEGNGEPVTPVETPAEEPELPVADDSKLLRIDALNVEFVAGDRNIDELLKLKSEFPKVLIAAMKKQNVELGEVTVTFGTSDEATVEALQSGAVDLGFISIESFFVREDILTALAVEEGGPELTLTAAAVPNASDAVISGRLANVTQALLASSYRDIVVPGAQELTAALCHYTDASGSESEGRFSDLPRDLDNLRRLYESGEAVLASVGVAVAPERTLTVQAIGARLDEYWWSVTRLEICEDGALLQTVTISDATAQLYADREDAEIYIEEHTEWHASDGGLTVEDLNFDGAEDLYLPLRMGTVNIAWLCWLWDADAGRFGDCFELLGYQLTLDAEAKRVVTESRGSWGEYDTMFYAPDETGKLQPVRWEAERAANTNENPSDQSIRIIYELQNGELVETAREPWVVGN